MLTLLLSTLDFVRWRAGDLGDGFTKRHIRGKNLFFLVPKCDLHVFFLYPYQFDKGFLMFLPRWTDGLGKAFFSLWPIPCFLLCFLDLGSPKTWVFLWNFGMPVSCF